eukprot:23214-Rhodomonas_salina.2
MEQRQRIVAVRNQQRRSFMPQPSTDSSSGALDSEVSSSGKGCTIVDAGSSRSIPESMMRFKLAPTRSSSSMGRFSSLGGPRMGLSIPDWA